jgi:hypothetical protein
VGEALWARLAPAEQGGLLMWEYLVPTVATVQVRPSITVTVLMVSSSS